eukprot:6470440-Amphidinium_carterae.1
MQAGIGKADHGNEKCIFITIILQSAQHDLRHYGEPQVGLLLPCLDDLNALGQDIYWHVRGPLFCSKASSRRWLYSGELVAKG